jgi:hypothetical protein
MNKAGHGIKIKNASDIRSVFLYIINLVEAYYFTNFTSTRLFAALPALVLLDSIGVLSPKPLAVNLAAEIPLFTK